MCGIAGAINFASSDLNEKHKIAVDQMCEQMRARGPDAFGTWKNKEGNVFFGHRRLSIIDLDPRAGQPMSTNDGRYTIVFNGEIYNYRELRNQLESAGTKFSTEGDTEVILKLYQAEGSSMLPKMRGMFAFAIWDDQLKKLFLARDPYGIKPLYYSKNPKSFFFASQVKSILSTGMVSKNPCSKGQIGFWLLGSVPEPNTWFNDIKSLPAGTFATISNEGQSFKVEKYWDIGDSWRNAPSCNYSKFEVQEIVQKSVSDSVKAHLVADVPVGVFLSGGIDSGSLAGLMVQNGYSDLNGITIAFEEFHGRHEDETPIAKSIANQYGIKHHVRVVTKKEFQTDLPKILKAMDQPTLDGINTWYASKAVAELNLKVVVSGVGGDELFFGYPSFKQIPTLVNNFKLIDKIPLMNKLADKLFSYQSERSGNSRWKWMTQLGSNYYGAYWLRRGLCTPEEIDGFIQNIKSNDDKEILKHPEKLIEQLVGSLAKNGACAVAQMESNIYMRNQLLRDSDWASMDHSVELRTPLVDAFLLRGLMPVLQSFSKFQGKVLLGKSPNPPLSNETIFRKKTGFNIPLNSWLKEELSSNKNFNPVQGSKASKEWAKTLVNSIYT